MKISFNWLKQLVDTDLSAEQLGSMLTKSGLEVEEIGNFEQIPGSLEGLVIGEVLTCDPHPNADNLKVTTVDAGKGSALHIVCGAPNVQKGQKVVVATEGVTLHSFSRELFTIKKTRIRGEVSEGMICAEDEIGLGKAHEGIIILDTKLPNGTPLTELFKVFKDIVFEIGLTPNRADAMSHWGVARDIKALTGALIHLPPVEGFKADDHDRPIQVTVENPDACPRYSGITISNVTISESPEWLKNRIRSIGLTPINNVVDVTNFILHEIGQPLHAFDYDKIGGKKVVVKTLPDNTPFMTLDGVERKLKSGDLMICDINEAMCIAGVFGGSKSGVSLSTRNIFLESAYFSPDYIRKTALVHDLKTDASFRFERGTDPNITVYALKRAAMLIREVAGGKISSEVVDVYPTKIGDFLIPVKYKNLHRLIGKEITHEEIKNILSLLDIRIENEKPEGFTALVPTYRVDVTREADITEEILRIYGYDNIPLSENLHAGFLAEFSEKDPIRLHEKIAQLLSAKGFNEILTNSITSAEIWNGIESFSEKENVEILNRISDDLGIMRQSLLFTGLPVIAYNVNHKQKNLKFFEIGKSYCKKEKNYIEKNEIAVYWTGDAEEENWNRKPRPVAFQDLYGVAQDILQKFNIRFFAIEPFEDTVFSEGLNLLVDGKIIASIGLLASTMTEKTGIRQDVYFMKMDFDLFLDIINTNITFREVPKYPEVRRDLSLVIDRKITFRDIMKVISRVERRLIRNVNVFDYYEGENIEQGKKAYALSFILQDPESTLTDKVIDKTMNILMESFEKELGAKIRK